MSFKYHGGGIYSRHNGRDGRTYYFIRYTLASGKRKQEKAGTRKKDAEALLNIRKSSIVRGTYGRPRRSEGPGGRVPGPRWAVPRRVR